jgi:hypothetical protein
VEVASKLDRGENIARVGCHYGVKKLMIVLIREVNVVLTPSSKTWKEPVCVTGRFDTNGFQSLVLCWGRRQWPVKAHLNTVSVDQSSFQSLAYLSYIPRALMFFVSSIQVKYLFNSTTHSFWPGYPHKIQESLLSLHLLQYLQCKLGELC